MMQAALLAAEAAMAEAAAQEAGGGGGGEDSDDEQAEMDDMYESNPSLGMDPDQLGFLKALQAAESGDQSGVVDEMHMMGLGNSNDESMQSLLQMLAQQEQENSRPDEHYLTIAQNGEYRYSRETYCLLVPRN
jgi:hypothetical protein